MSLSMSITEVCLLACHGGTADHFASWAEELSKEGYNVRIFAAEGPALKKFAEREVKVYYSFSLEKLNEEEKDSLAAQIAKTCSAADFVLTGVADAFEIKVQNALTTFAKKTAHWVLYENSEDFVPGGYSSNAADAMENENAEGVLFAGEPLAEAPIYREIGKEIDTGAKKRFGVGYYPVVTHAKKIAERRKLDQASIRASFFIKNKIADSGQKVVVYFGGNNKVYYSEAFPAFLSFLVQASEKKRS